MDKSRSRLSQKERNKQFIVKSKRNLLRDASVLFFSSLVWIYVLCVIYFFIDVLLELNHTIPSSIKSWFRMSNDDVRSFLLLVLLGFIIIYSLMWTWSKYNKLKYGPLRRRTYPKDSEITDFVKLGMMDFEMIHHLQNSKEITLEKNPLK